MLAGPSTSSLPSFKLALVVYTADYFQEEQACVGVEQGDIPQKQEDIPQRQQEQEKTALEISLVKVSLMNIVLLITHIKDQTDCTLNVYIDD